MHFVQQYIDRCKGNQEVINFINTVVNAHVTKTGQEDQGEIEHILDYLLSDKAPKRLRKMSYEQAKQSAEKWVKSLIKKGNNITETEEDVKRLKMEMPDGFYWVKLKSENAYKREGNLMSHCVASYYGNKHVNIYSLRDANNQPHCTIELQKGATEANQCKGRGNGEIHPKYISMVLDFFKKKNLTIRESELKYLGYLSFENNKETWKLIEKTFKASSIKYLTFNGKKYLYKESKLDRK